MTSKAKEALVFIHDLKEFGYAPMTMAAFFQHYEDTVAKALTILAAIESGEMKKDHEVRLSWMKEGDFMNYGWNDCLEHLKEKDTHHDER